MCGVFGVLGQHPKKADQFFTKIATTSQRRGQDTFGAFSVSENQTHVHVLKDHAPAKKVVGGGLFSQFTKTYQNEKTVSLVGHTRLATNGDWSILDNNQPVLYKHWICVHNGIITNEKLLKDKYISANETTHDLDTYSLLGLLENVVKNSTNTDTSTLLRKVSSDVIGANNFVIYSSKIQKILFYSSNGSLYLGKDNDNVWHFASEKKFLENCVEGHITETVQIKSDIFASFDTKTNQLMFIGQGEEKLDPIRTESKQRPFYLHKSTFEEFRPRHTDMSKLKNVMTKQYESVLKKTKDLKRCNKCLLPETFPGIVIDETSCSVCKSYSPVSIESNLGNLKNQLGNKNEPILVSLSGGRDSCYSIHILKELLGREIKAFTYDWGMVTDLARRNQSRICGRLGIEHIIVAADIQRKRRNIRKNVKAWLHRPSLGTIPLFMAGDKHYFYYSEKIKKELGYSYLAMGENKLEKTGFKTKFAGATQSGSKSNMAYNLSAAGKMKMLQHYGTEFLINPKYWNDSLFDTFKGFVSYYILPRSYINVFDYVNWKEDEVEKALALYDWEYAVDCDTSWRIGDGTAPFYNYIYHTIAGFSENDTIRANQIREGHISLEEGKRLIKRDNRPRAESFKWYCDVLKLDPLQIAKRINEIPKLYERTPVATLHPKQTELV